MPNITGSFSRVVEPNHEPTGAFKKRDRENSIGGGTTAYLFNIEFSARDGETDASGNLKTGGHLEYGSHNETTVKNSTIRLWKRTA